VKIELERYRTLLRVFWGVWLAGVVWGSLVSGNEMSSLENVVPFLQYDKLVHGGAYAGLALLSMLAFERRRGIAVALSMILLGAVIELLQHFSPGRTPDVADAIANSVGVLSGIALGILLTTGLARSRRP
jgi:VanZ family protein